MTALLDILQDVLQPSPGEPTLPEGFPVAHLSPSSIDSFWKCPEQFRREKIDKEARPSSAELIFGSAFHRAAETNFLQKIDSHEDIPVQEMRDLAGDSFNTVLEEEKGTREIVWHDNRPNDIQAGVVTAMVGTESLPGYHQVLAPAVQPVAVERWIRVDTPAGIPLVGRIDVETVDLNMIDLKTSKRAKTQADLDKSTQATSYMWARQQEGNPSAVFSWHTAIRTVKPQQQELMTRRSERELGQFERLVQVTVDAIVHNLEMYGAEGPWPASSPLAWWCAPTQCSFYPSCPWRAS